MSFVFPYLEPVQFPDQLPFGPFSLVPTKVPHTGKRPHVGCVPSSLLTSGRENRNDWRSWDRLLSSGVSLLLFCRFFVNLPFSINLFLIIEPDNVFIKCTLRDKGTGLTFY